MRFGLHALLFAVLICASALSVPNIGSSQANTSNGALKASLDAFSELKTADSAGANITVLAVKYNSALALLDSAQRLADSGNSRTASALASEAEQVFTNLVPEVEKIKNDAIVQKRTEAKRQLVMIPLEAFVLALGVGLIYVVRQRVEFRQLEEQGIRPKGSRT